MERVDPAQDAGLEAELEDRLGGAFVSDPTEDEGRAADPGYETWLDARAEEMEAARYELIGFAAETARC